MIYTSDLEEYLRLRQLFQLSGEQVNYHPGIFATQPPVHSTEWSLYNPSMSHASESLDPNWSMHTTIGHPTPDNLYQGTMQSSSTMEHRPTEDGIEDRPNPSQTTTHIQSSAPSPSTQETSPNENNIGVADMQASSPQRQEWVVTSSHSSHFIVNSLPPISVHRTGLSNASGMAVNPAGHHNARRSAAMHPWCAISKYNMWHIALSNVRNVIGGLAAWITWKSTGEDAIECMTEVDTDNTELWSFLMYMTGKGRNLGIWKALERE